MSTVRKYAPIVCWVCEGKRGGLSKLEIEKGEVHEFCRSEGKRINREKIQAK